MLSWEVATAWDCSRRQSLLALEGLHQLDRDVLRGRRCDALLTCHHHLPLRTFRRTHM